MTTYCKNKKCGDAIRYNPLIYRAPLFCPACRSIGRVGFALGGFLVGAIFALVEILK